MHLAFTESTLWSYLFEQFIYIHAAVKLCEKNYQGSILDIVENDISKVKKKENFKMNPDILIFTPCIFVYKKVKLRSVKVWKRLCKGKRREKYKNRRML